MVSVTSPHGWVDGVPLKPNRHPLLNSFLGHLQSSALLPGVGRGSLEPHADEPSELPGGAFKA